MGSAALIDSDAGSMSGILTVVRGATDTARLGECSAAHEERNARQGLTKRFRDDPARLEVVEDGQTFAPCRANATDEVRRLVAVAPT